MISIFYATIIPTIFPDKTSQVWKLPPLKPGLRVSIRWDFESESELMHIAQLAMLLKHEGRAVSLFLPFLPYGRQDKEVSNESTFALRTFASLINSIGFEKIETIDAHSDVFLKLTGATSISPEEDMWKVFEDTGADLYGLPDTGAFNRYKFNKLHCVIGHKVRDQLTGRLEYIGINGADVTGKKVLIVDDICDGGATFIAFAEQLYAKGAVAVYLYTTHGIYSKGLDVLRNAKISRIFNHKGEVT